MTMTYTVKIVRHTNARTLTPEYRIEITRLVGTRIKPITRSSALTELPTIEQATQYAADAGFTVTALLTQSPRVTLLRAEPIG